MDEAYEKLHDTLMFYGVDCVRPYYISSGNPIPEFPKTSFRVDYYAVCVCVEGQIGIEIDNLQYHLSENEFLVLAPSTVLRFVETDGQLRMRLLLFDKNFLLKNIADPFFLDKMGLFGGRSFRVIRSNVADANRIFSLLEYLQEASQRNGRYTLDLVRTLIFNVLLEVAEIVANERREEGDVVADGNCLYFRFMELVCERVGQHKDVAYYADCLCVSNKYLINAVKRGAGKTPHQIIDEYILKEALALLGNPEKTVSDVAYAIGFNSVSAFGRFFKKYSYVSPSEYRRAQVSGGEI
ncbi:MAG: helix-turn-helix domain-containing protein [Sphingobacterium sp.]|jgi:AraC-like DNA-binding protein|nr:helix-turn-helix domain-containing protein [Sphingobacterium sp.]